MSKHLPREVVFNRAIHSMIQDITESQILKRKYQAERDAFKSSPAGLRDARIRGLSQKASSAEEEIKQQIYNVMIELKDGIFNSIVEDLKLINEDFSLIPMDKLKLILKSHYGPITKLKTLSESYPINKNNQSKHIPYDLLFGELVDEADIRFVMFATPETIVRSKTKIYKLPEELKEEFLMYLKGLNLTKEQKALFNRYHGRSFKNVHEKEN